MGGVFLRSDNIRLDKNRSSQENENTLVLGTADGAIKKIKTMNLMKAYSVNDESWSSM
jgi:hypothetical protein